MAEEVDNGHQFSSLIPPSNLGTAHQQKTLVIGVRPVFAKLVIEHAQHLFKQTLLSAQKINRVFFFT